jgi:hypothetical protein
VKGSSLGGEFIDESAMALLQRLLNERRHEEVAADIDVLPQIETLSG